MPLDSCGRWETVGLDDLASVFSWRPSSDLGPTRPPRLRRRGRAVFRGDCGDDVDSLDPVSPSLRPPPPLTLLCHDLKGGYLQDRFASGAAGLADPPYVFGLWSAVDLFVYFSHHFVSPPPLGWISAAHRNGVRAMGTIITEFGRGKGLCREFLADAETRARLVSALVEIAGESGFDGWLVNIENELSKDHVDSMIELVRDLTRQMHARIPDSVVIWYDAVTAEGKLEWQDELNGLNGPFFDVCDGIFLNYTWKTTTTTVLGCGRGQKKDSLANSLEYLERKGSLDRRRDVFVGVDVFGRGCVGGGGFNSDEAMKLIRKYSLSAALFAPGWTHEKAPDPTDHAALASREQAFWRTMRKHLFLRGPKLESGEGGGVSEEEQPPCLFSSCFCSGFGRRGLGEEEGEEEKEEQQKKKPEPSSKEIKGGGKGGGGEAADSTTSSSKEGGEGNWWLDMTRQEFQSSFPHPHPQWPWEAWEKREEKGGNHDYCLFADPSSQAKEGGGGGGGGGGGVCLQVWGVGRGGEKINVPLLLCEVSCSDDEEEALLAFLVTHREGRQGEVEEEGGGGGASVARDEDDDSKRTPFGVRLRVATGGGEDGDCRTVEVEETPPDVSANLEEWVARERRRRRGDAAQDGDRVSCFLATLAPGSALLAVALAAEAGTRVKIGRLSIYRKAKAKFR